MLLAAFASLLVLRVSAQETFDLQLRLGRGEVLYYARSLEGTLSMHVAVEGVPPIDASATFQGKGRAAARVLDVGQDGAMLVEFVVEDLRVTANGNTEEPTSEPALWRVRPDGKIVEWLIKPKSYEGSEDFPSILPGRPVKVGDSWTAQTTLRSEDSTIAMNQTVTLLGVEAGADGRVARLRYTEEGTAIEIKPPFPPPPGSQWRTLTGTIRGTGEMDWLVDRGRVATDKEDATGEFQAELVGPNSSFQGRGTFSLKSEDRALPRESVSVSSPHVEFLIAPGDGIGPFTLGSPLANLNEQLGDPSAPAMLEGFTAPEITWETISGGFGRRVVAYVDPADPTRVVGLETGDYHYRTDRGIGFGSSQGAVLFAYGMSPVTIEAGLPLVGDVHLLVYDDQGIAFAITSAVSHHLRVASEHAPVGAVHSIFVFPKGSAGKIFKMP